MKYVLLFIIASFVQADEEPSTKIWRKWGNYGAIVHAMNDNAEDSNFQGLTVECSPSNKKIRISIRDINAQPNDTINWKTDKKNGSFVSTASVVPRTHENHVQLNNELISAMLEGKWIAFKNERNESMAVYTLKGAPQTIKNILP